VLVVDLNLLLYATNSDSADHATAKAWWEATLSNDEPIGLAWVVVLGFLRISTHPRILSSPLTTGQATGVVDDWLAQAPARLLLPSERHWGILRQLLEPVGTAGNLTTDAHLAALAIENGATLCSTDRDFGRFQNLKWTNPLDQRR
jgi:toxin-antitoxin system PIN domain toxin